MPTDPGEDATALPGDAAQPADAVPVGSSSAALGKTAPPLRFSGLSPVSLAVALGGVLFCAAWPLGSNRYLALHVLCIAVGAVLTAACCFSGRTLGPVKATAREIGPVAMLALPVIIWAFAQATVSVAAPLGHPAWSIASEALGEDLPAYIAIDRSRAIFEATKLLLAAGMFATAALIGHNRAASSVILAGVALTAIVYSIYGIVLAGLRIPHSFLTGWEGPFPYSGARASGTLVSPNHFAAFASIGALACFALLTAKTGEVVVERGPRVMLRTFLSFLFGRNGYWAGGFVVCLGAVLVSGSRAGGLALAIAVGLLALLTGMSAPRGRRMVPALFGLSLLALAAVMAAIGGGLTSDRLDSLVQKGDPLRLQMWQAAWDGITASPWLGFGLGGFQAFFDTTTTMKWPMTVDYAHSDWLEFPFSLGIPAALVWWSALLLVFGRLIWGLRVRQRDQHILCAGVSVMVFAALHAVVDSSLSIPVIACMFAAVAGAASGQCKPSASRIRA